MTLRLVKNNLRISGVEYDIWYDPNTGTTQVRRDVGTFGNVQGELVWDYFEGPTNPNDSNSSFINAIKADENTVKNMEKLRKNTENGVRSGFITDDDVNLSGADGPLTKKISEIYKNSKKDVYFDGKKSAQYPKDALYGKKNSQDHLVISQYRYKPPRADDIWGQKQPGVILTQGIARNSPLDEFLGLVKMPMPNAIQDSNNVAWGEDTVNALEAAALNTVQPNLGDIAKSGITGGLVGIGDLLLGGSGAAGSSAIATQVGTRMGIGAMSEGNFGSTILAPEAVSRILGTLGIETSAEAILARKDGVVPNSNLELLFSGPTLRQFSFVYKMSPRSKPEASIVNQILRFFKQGMSARKQNAKGGGELAGGRSYFLGTPNVFRLQYRTDENEAIKGLNRIKTCALTGTSVNYTPEGAFASYEKGQPVSVLLSLSFQELEPIYDSDYKYGGDDGERKNDTGEGYRWKLDKNNNDGYGTTEVGY